MHLLYFYTDRRGLSPALAGLAFFLGLALDALSDPLAGNLSDRARFRSGRRRPFFLSAAPMGLCLFLLLTPPNAPSILFGWFLGCYFLMLTARKLYETAYGALMPELTLDYDERTRLSTYRQLFGTIGDVSGALFPFAASWLFARGTDFRVTGALAALIVGAGAALGYAGTRERPEYANRERFNLREAVRSTFQNRPFVILLLATALAVMAVNVPAVLMRFLAKYWYHDENAAARWLIAYFAGSMVSYPFWFKITVRIEKKPALRGRDALQRGVPARVHGGRARQLDCDLPSDDVLRLLGDRHLGNASLGLGGRDRVGRRTHRAPPGGRLRGAHLDGDKAGGGFDDADGRAVDGLDRLRAGRRGDFRRRQPKICAACLRSFRPRFSC